MGCLHRAAPTAALTRSAEPQGAARLVASACVRWPVVWASQRRRSGGRVPQSNRPMRRSWDVGPDRQLIAASGFCRGTGGPPPRVERKVGGEAARVFAAAKLQGSWRPTYAIHERRRERRLFAKPATYAARNQCLVFRPIRGNPLLSQRRHDPQWRKTPVCRASAMSTGFSAIPAAQRRVLGQTGRSRRFSLSAASDPKAVIGEARFRSRERIF